MEAPRTIRNRNYLYPQAIMWFTVGALLVAANALAELRFGWEGVVIAALPTLLGLWEVHSWRHYSLEVGPDGLTFGRLVGSTTVRWEEIESFEMRPPGVRTLVNLRHPLSNDKVRVHLVDGSEHLVRAIEPRHGFTSISRFTMLGWNEADDRIAELNLLLQRDRVEAPRPSMARASST